MFDLYYRDELERLRHLAVDYADKEPELARHLVPGSDPDVERLLEGVAFLTAGLRDQMQRQAPELTRNLLEVTAPDSLLALPSTALLQFLPRNGLKEALYLPAGTPVGSDPRLDKKVVFTTSQACRVLPLQLTNCEVAEVTSRADGASCYLDLELQATASNLAELLSDHPLDIQISGNLANRADIYWLLVHESRAIEVLVEGQSQPGVEACIEQSERAFPLDSESLDAAVKGYLHNPESNLALRLKFTGLQKVAGSRMTLRFWMDDSRLSLPDITVKNFHLNTVPVHNLFRRQLPPFLRNDLLLSQPLKADTRQGKKLLVHRIQEVTGLYTGASEPHTYLPYWAVENRSRAHAYQLHYRLDELTGLPEFGLILAKGRQIERGREEMLRVEALCSNGQVAGGLLPGDLNAHVQGSPEQVDFRNLTTSTAWKPPALNPEAEQEKVLDISAHTASIFSHAGLLRRLRSLADQVSPDEAQRHINEKKIQAIQNLQVVATEKLLGQSLYRGLQLNLSINGKAFNSLGETLVFCDRLNQLFSQSAPINHFTALQIHEAQTGEEFIWPARLSQQLLG
ncbi:type VI secretion system baseplate subunit TssF [Marinospirillum sp.]|uniref:type VI secretion system baseplate subunit TssF n=1 Tax=Marinospirillum sp. TaxID=2183934 RepID=UPI00287020D6|nr:type VI secretion system baseplate subunit TssF [Marinospirillum sp.]MDR9467440.1 type VI secretion system baseplate subunit TssF [Marinospirillum sp.]